MRMNTFDSVPPNAKNERPVNEGPGATSASTISDPFVRKDR